MDTKDGEQVIFEIPYNPTFTDFILKFVLAWIEKNIFLCIIGYIIFLIIIIEIFAYFWHRYASHNNIFLRMIRFHHSIHHNDDTDNAENDFVWILLLLLASQILLFIIFSITFHKFNSSILFAIVTLIVTNTMFYYNWYIHSSYHDHSHWLHRYSWFRNATINHHIHHVYPTKHFSIASYFPDKIFGTWR